MGAVAVDSVSFPDIEGHWAQATIEALADEGIINGFPDGGVHPDEQITRAEFSALVCRSKGIESDTSGGESWAAGYIAALTETGIIAEAGVAPDEPITRIEMIRMLVRALNTSCENDEAYISKAKEYDIINGFPDGSVRPDSTATRAEAFTMLVWQRTAAEAIEPEPTPTLVPTGDGGGGYYVPPVPAAEISFALPETAYVGESVVIEATIKGAASVEIGRAHV